MQASDYGVAGGGIELLYLDDWRTQMFCRALSDKAVD